MNVTEMMLQRAETDLQQAQADAEKAEAAHLAAQSRLTEMRAVRDWLQQYGKSGDGVDSQVPVRFGRPVPEIPQTELCVRALEKIGRAATNAEIRERLHLDGYEFDQVQIRSALKYLGRKKPSRVESPSPGVWRLLAAAPFASASGPVLNGAGRES